MTKLLTYVLFLMVALSSTAAASDRLNARVVNVMTGDMLIVSIDHRAEGELWGRSPHLQFLYKPLTDGGLEGLTFSFNRPFLFLNRGASTSSGSSPAHSPPLTERGQTLNSEYE